MPMTMLREKLLNAVLYFAKNTKYCNTTKISKLLYFLDFVHFKETGYPSIGLKYYSFERGPVPKDFWLEVRDGNVPEDFKDKLRLMCKTDEFSPGYKETDFIAIASPDMDVFTSREKKILENLAFIYKEARANTISEVTHLANQPWDITKKKKGLNKTIDYIDSIDSQSSLGLDEATDSIKDFDETIRNLHLKPTR